MLVPLFVYSSTHTDELMMIKCEKGNVSINGAGNEVIHDLSEIISRTYSSFSKAFGEEKTKQMIFKAVNAGMGADK